jgi:PAS domain S-box-containing protein
MITIDGYRVDEKLSENTNTLVYRGRRDADDQPVILKALKQAYPSPQTIAWFKREYEIMRTLNLPGAVGAYSLQTDHNQWVMVLEDFGGESLARLQMVGPLGLTEFLRLSIQVADALGQIHQQNIVHKDINPSHILLNPATGQAKLTDFGSSSALSQENLTIRNPSVLEGTLAYMSPEQTGRMNRTMDYRADLYSLGVTFYQLLTGQLPFSSTDLMELVHCHIAKKPKPPCELNPDAPQVISDIVMRLLAKNADDRYQSAYGLKADLEECLRQWLAEGRIELFALGKNDVSDRFQIPQKLYGREAEITTLLSGFDRVNRGASETMLVSGYAGIGKTALIQEVYRPITRQRGYFIAGKFDQFQRNVPYAALIQAFRSLMQQVLTESEAQITIWRERLLAALGPNGQVVIEVIPEMELIIGPQPVVPELPPAEAQNRLNLVIQNFIRVFTRAEHPLAVFLDDLQWADAASLRLFRLLTTASDCQYLFFIGAYRDSEVSQTHPLMLTVNEIRQAGKTVTHITLSPLSLPDIVHFVADTLHCGSDRARSLAELVRAKTGGNPFFMIEFLRSLYAGKLLDFNHQRGGWQWDLAQIQAQDFTANVVELLAGKIQKLKPEAQTVLKLAACIGNQFDLRTLSIVYEKSSRETAADLWQGIAEGLILPLGGAYKLAQLDVEGLAEELAVEYKFAHDRIRQAVYSLIPVEQKQAIHYQVGRLLLQNTLPESQEESIFEIVNQLNYGRGLIAEQAEQIELARLNLMAGRKAKSAAAYEVAFSDLQVGVELLSSVEDIWQRRYDLTLALYVEAAETAYLSGDFEQMERLAQAVLSQAKTLPDEIKVYEVKIQAYIAQNRLLEAVRLALSVLKVLGVRLPEKPNRLDILLGLLRTKLALVGKRIEDLIDLPEMTDSSKRAAMRILSKVASAAYLAAPDLLPLVVFKSVNLSVKYGRAPESAFAYAGYGFIMCRALGDIDSGYRFGQLALSLAERSDAKELRARTSLTANAFVRHWKEHVRASLQPLLGAYQSGLETGDLEYAAHSARNYVAFSFYVGKDLPELEREIASYSETVRQLKQASALYLSDLYRQVVLNLMGNAKDPTVLSGAAYDEETMLPLHLEANDRAAIYNLYFNKLVLCYDFQHYPQAIEYARLTEKNLGGAAATPLIPLFHFYDSLARLAVYPGTPMREQKRFLKKVTANQKKLKKWARHAPMNQLHRYYLVEAERARVLGNDGEAREFYDNAIALVQESNYPNEEALANELAGRYYLARGLDRLAVTYLLEARYSYLRWGAIAKVEALEEEHLSGSAEAPLLSQREEMATTRGAGGVLDLRTVMKALQAISGEILLDRLLEQLMKIVIENAGAQTGYLVLEKGVRHQGKAGQWAIEAEGTVGKADVTVLQSIPATERVLPMSVVNYVARTKENVVLDDAANEGPFTQDPYVKANQSRSILCAPLLYQRKLTGMLYLENNLTSAAFTPNRLTVLNLLSSQAAISIENARLYADLGASEKKYRALFEDSRDTIYIITAAGQILDVNPAGLNLFGYSREELAEVNAADLYVNPDDRARFQQEIERQGVVRDFEVQFRRKDGTEMDCLMTSTVRRDADGAVSSYQGIIRDVTERKRAERLLAAYSRTLEKRVEQRTAELAQMTREAQEARIAAEAANRAKSTFLANMSHELRTPLNAIIGYSEMLAEDFEDEQGLEAFIPDLQKIRAAGKHLLSLINDVLDLSKIEAGKMELYLETFEVSRLIEDVVNTVQPLVEKNANTLEVLRASNLGTMHADLTKVRQSLFNLFSNAAKFTERGTITLGAARERVDGTDWVSFSVKDTGIGMKPEQVEKLFQPFWQAEASTARKYGGTGLGLAVTHHFCQMMGGEISVESEYTLGSTFIIRLPAEVAAHEAQPTFPAESRFQPTEEGASTVLVIDDDPTVHDMMRRFLRREGFRVETASSGVEGLRLVRELRPDAVTLDVLMPGIDGWTVLTTLKADRELADIPVIMLTIVDEKNMGYTLGASNYLTKPVDRERLVTVLREHASALPPFRVLVVDDEPVMRKMLRRMLENEGWDVSEAENGRVALERVVENPPRLIILDLIMPEMDGFQVMVQLRENEVTRSIPVVVITAKDLTAEERRRLNGCVEKILQKQAYSREALLAQVRQLVAGCIRQGSAL